MKVVAILLVFGGYSLFVYGYNHITNGCYSFKDVVWPSATTPTDPCAGGNAGKSSATPTKNSNGSWNQPPGWTQTPGQPFPTPPPGWTPKIVAN